MISLQDIIKERIEAFNKNPEKALEVKKSDYIKAWNKGVQFFQREVNKDRIKEKQPIFEFIVIRQKLLALREIDDLRWFYYHCKKYAGTKDKQGRKNTFSKCFWGALKIK